MQSNQEIARVAVVGAGIMGSGIAQLAAMAGYEVALCDMAPEQLERARGLIGASIDKLTGKGRLDRGAGQQALRRVRLSGSLAEAAAGADLVIEAVVEVLAVKQSVLREAMAVAGPGALYGTNTSQLSITAIAGGFPEAADRVVGLHFFNPVVLMRLVEVVRGLQTSDATVAAAQQFARTLGKDTVVCQKDSPGFLLEDLVGGGEPPPGGRVEQAEDVIDGQAARSCPRQADSAGRQNHDVFIALARAEDEKAIARVVGHPGYDHGAEQPGGPELRQEAQPEQQA